MITRLEFLASSAALAATAAVPNLAQTGPISLGKLQAFWRYSAGLGPYLEIGNGLMAVPDYMSLGDFPYRKRPFPKDVLFADELSLVRLLGGYRIPGKTAKQAALRDLAWRDSDGTIQYRKWLLRPRLEPYITHGYDLLTLVLDNVPYCFPAHPKANGLGQYMPPRDPAEWKAFIVEVAQWILEIFGPEKASMLRFRVGTENDSKGRWGGTQAQYIRHYKDSADAVLGVIPRAKISFYNISGVSVKAMPYENVDAFAVAQSCYRQPAHTPIDFIPFSRYYWEKNDPPKNAAQCAAVWDHFGKIVPELKGTSREIQEFGIATWEMTKAGQPSRSEPGALGAAQLMQMVFELRAAGTDRLWHWNPLDTEIRDGQGKLRSLPTGQAWVYSILEYMAGGEVSLLPVSGPNVRVKRLAAASVQPTSTLVLVSAYLPDEAIRPAQMVTVQLGSATSGAAAPRIARLNTSNCVHSLVRADLAVAGLLSQPFIQNPWFLGFVREMETSPQGEVLIAQNERRYLDAWTSSLTLRPFTPADGRIDGPTCRLRIGTPEIVVLAL